MSMLMFGAFHLHIVGPINFKQANFHKSQDLLQGVNIYLWIVCDVWHA